MIILRIMRFRPAMAVGAQASGTSPSMAVAYLMPQSHACMQPIEVPMMSRR